MFLVSEEFVASTHGSLGCITCHGGENAPDKAVAHTDMNPYPSRDYESTCSACHSDVTGDFDTAIHFNLNGMANGLSEYAGITSLSESPHHEEVFGNDCYKCHATCGDCHVSRPKNFSNGLVEQHTFQGTPSMENNCYACHNARNGGEFMGLVGFGSDVHFDAGMTCMDCHPVNNFHGTGEVPYDMWEVDLPSCTDCHTDKDPAVATDVEHKVHGDSLSCQVCHAQANNNCYECHLDEKADGSGLQSSSEMKIQFRVGYNPEPTEERPYKYVVLRHVPGQESMLEVVEENMMPNFDQKVNWNYSPSHNVQKSTFQNESCEACHTNTRIWLTEDDLRETDSEANKALIPALPPSLDH
ncbi:multiheme c-type cytochrome [Gudongella oleilytica]|jgi:thiosulfate/3-mercaptopyruvate sulfurtransferase|uniref:multiheme c-type cytochrome n=1 Tax=Gudongella oleilytica TaxID=1582259 RepID=UPI000FF88185|nr:multiheme c-type cytochrome [Gudongella oleilytica]HMM69903.1 cytochrome c3 family protein [Gudongella oleilytica]